MNINYIVIKNSAIHHETYYRKLVKLKKISLLMRNIMWKSIKLCSVLNRIP